MKFLFKKRRQEDLQKITSFQEQLENINGLVDPIERVLLLEKLRDKTDGARGGVSGRIHDNCVLLGAGGCLMIVAGVVAFSPLVMMLGFLTTMGNLLLGDLFQKPEEIGYKTLLGEIDLAIETITKKTSLETLAASPQLGTAMRCFPVLRERFEDAANMERYQKMLSAPVVVTKTPAKVSKPRTLNNKDDKGAVKGFRL